MAELIPFHATFLFLYPLKTSENQRFSGIFREYSNGPVAWNGLLQYFILKPWEKIGYFR